MQREIEVDKKALMGEILSKGKAPMALLNNYFTRVPENKRTAAAIAYLASIDHLQESSPEIAKSIVQELKDQRSHLKMIASENYCSLAVQLSMGNLLTDKYSEGYPGHRFYAGCENVDAVEGRANDLLKKIFCCDHAYVQPHSGADANLVAFWSVLVQKIQDPLLDGRNPNSLSDEEYEKIRKKMLNQKLMGLSLNSGGHLTHGYRHNVSAKMMHAVTYDVDPRTGLIDYKTLEQLVREEKPLILLAGYSAYSRLIDFAKMREIADSVGAVLITDMAHFAGLVAGKVMTGNYDPVPFSHIVTSTTHKTMRGPRGGMILCKEEFRETIDKGCPLVLGGPMPHVIAAKAVAFHEANGKSFRNYAEQIVKNARALSDSLMEQKVSVITGGTDNHLVLIDVHESFGLTGRQAEMALRDARFTVNRNTIPGDVQGPWYTSGIRLGTAALTTLGMKENEMKEIGKIFVYLLRHTKPDIVQKTGGQSRAKYIIAPTALESARKQVAALLQSYPLYPEILVD